MANVIRAHFQGKSGYLNITKGILTLYGGSKPVKWDITKRETTELLREFLNKAHAEGKFPSMNLHHNTGNNAFIWGTRPGTKKVILQRWDLNNLKMANLKPNTEFTKQILSAMVRANVK
jgi:hypothetical protein